MREDRLTTQDTAPGLRRREVLVGTARRSTTCGGQVRTGLPRRGGLVAGAAGAVAVLFGVATLMAGGRVLLGASDPGYVVFRPLLIYNTVMGFAYLAAGVAMWRCLRCGTRAAAIVFALNLLVLGGISAVHGSGGAVASESLRAMSLRTAVWLGLLMALLWEGRRRAQYAGE